MNKDLRLLQPYPFERLRTLLSGVVRNNGIAPIALSIGEPKHPSPAFVGEALTANLDKLAIYPATQGTPVLREAIARWCEQRFDVPSGWLDAARHVLPVNGTREALFSFTQAIVDRDADGLVLSPIRSTKSTKAQRSWPGRRRTIYRA